ALREEEREAWQRLIRVLGHEMNNSLAPIRSIAGSLERTMRRDPRPRDWDQDVERGLAVIASRVDALGRFMDAYARLARLPKPRLAPVDVATAVKRAVSLEARMPIAVSEGPPAQVLADADQLEQVMINIVRNAVDAALETRGAVWAGWAVSPREGEITIDDEGPGLLDNSNLFVPVFPTKPEGSGIGLRL